jgi:hypothetical protein
MDRVGDVWREVFKKLDKDFICSVLTPYFQKAKPEPLSLARFPPGPKDAGGDSTDKGRLGRRGDVECLCAEPRWPTDSGRV